MQEELNDRLSQIPEGCDIVAARDKIFIESIGEDKRGFRRTYGIGVPTPTSTNSKQLSSESLRMVEDEAEKRRALEHEMTVEVQKRKDLEEEVACETEKRKELEDEVANEKRKRMLLEEEVAEEKRRRIDMNDELRLLKQLVLSLQPTLNNRYDHFTLSILTLLVIDNNVIEFFFSAFSWDYNDTTIEMFYA